MPEKPEPDFGLDALVKEIKEALEQAPPETGGWIRMEDLYRATNLSKNKISQALRALLRQGKLEQGRYVPIERLGDGATILVFGYRLKEDDKALPEVVTDVQEAVD